MFNVADTSCLDAYILPPDYESNGSGFRLASRQQATTNLDEMNPTTDSLTGQPATDKSRPLNGHADSSNGMNFHHSRSMPIAAPSSYLPAYMSTVEEFGYSPPLKQPNTTDHNTLETGVFPDMASSEMSIITGLI